MTTKPSDGESVRRAVLCADDYAQTQETVEGILSLVDSSRLSAVSCMVESPLWAEAGIRLRGRPQTFDIGLHFNLTHDFAGNGHRAATLPMTILASYAGTIDREAIQERLGQQLDLFEYIIGRPPDFVDGHHHVHQLPVIRDALISVLRSRGLTSSIAVRTTVPAIFRGFKGTAIAGLGGRKLLAALRAEGIRHNTDFAGVYDFTSFTTFSNEMWHWLEDLQDGGLLVCHPARNQSANGDPIAEARLEEYAHLNSHSFLSTVKHRGVQLVRFRDLPQPG